MKTLSKYEGKVTVIRIGHDYFYTLELRRIWFLFRGRWKKVSPEHQPTYEKALKLGHKYNDTRTIFT